MAVKSFVRSQLLEVIECPDISPDIIVYRFPVLDNEIKNGAQLIVREGQNAVLVSNGQIADVFPAGRYKLKTENVPVLTKINSWSHGFKSPFKAEVYFVSTTQFTNIKWGTPNPILLRDNDFGMVRIRAFGSFSFRINDASIFMKEIFGAISKFSAENISSYLKAMVVSSFTDMLAETKIAALDLAAYYDELGYESTHRMRNRFNKNGLELVDLVIENISLPEEVEKIVDRKTSVGVIGDSMDEYARMQAIEAMGNVAKKEGASSSVADLGLALGTAGVVGETFKNMYNRPMSNIVNCIHCNALIGRKSSFCPQCGESNKGSTKHCVDCNSVIAFNAKFCPDCGKKLFDNKKANICKNCGKIADDNDKFCSECGSPT